VVLTSNAIARRPSTAGPHWLLAQPGLIQTSTMPL